MKLPKPQSLTDHKLDAAIHFSKFLPQLAQYHQELLAEAESRLQKHNPWKRIKGHV